MDKNLGNDTHDVGTGTVGTNVSATEYGDGKNHATKLTLTAVSITVGDNAALGVGSLIYTFPTGIIHLNSSNANLAMTTVEGVDDTPEMGLGTVIASGVNSTLGAVGATSENIAGPFVLADTNGTTGLMEQHTVGTFIIAAADVHAVFLNFADTWANVSDTGSTVTGTVWLNWTLLD